MPQSRRSISRRKLLADVAKGIGASTVAAGFPAIVPSSVFGATSPSNRLNIGAIGTGRISRGHDMPGVWKFDTRPDHGGVRPRPAPRRGRQDAGERLLQQADRQALRRRHRLLRLQASCSRTRTSTAC